MTDNSDNRLVTEPKQITEGSAGSWDDADDWRAYQSKTGVEIADTGRIQFEPTFSSDLPLYDDFESGTLSQNWQRYQNTENATVCAVTDTAPIKGTYSFEYDAPNNTPTGYVGSDATFAGGVEVAVDVRIDQGNDADIIDVYVADDFGPSTEPREGYRLNYYGRGGEFSLGRINADRSKTQIDSTDLSLSQGAVHTFRLLVKDGVVKGKINDTTLSGTDTKFQPNRIGLRSNEIDATFDSVRAE